MTRKRHNHLIVIGTILDFNSAPIFFIFFRNNFMTAERQEMKEVASPGDLLLEIDV